MGVGADIIGMVKTNTKVFCKESIENLTNNCPGGSYLMLKSKPMAPWYRPLITFDYKYNAQRVLYFNVTEDSWSTKAGITYLSK